MDINRRTRNLFRKFKTNCPIKISRMLNIIIIYLDLPDGVNGYCDRILRRKYIVIDEKLPEEEQVFVIAHELGHILLHGGLNHYFITRNTYFPIGRYEREANQFAISLLLYGSTVIEGETKGSYFDRHGIPLEMIDLLQ